MSNLVEDWVKERRNLVTGFIYSDRHEVRQESKYYKPIESNLCKKLSY